MAAVRKLPRDAIVFGSTARVIRPVLHEFKRDPSKNYYTVTVEVWGVHTYGKRTAYGERTRWKQQTIRTLTTGKCLLRAGDGFAAEYESRKFASRDEAMTAVEEERRRIVEVFGGLKRRDSVKTGADVPEFAR